MTREIAKKYWHPFPELNDVDNETILSARMAGFMAMYPCYPSAQAQAENTLAGAKQFLADH